MPHGGWVAFEKNEVHDCKGPTKAETPNPPLRKPLPISEPIEFPDIEVPDDLVAGQGIKSRTEKPMEEGLPPVPGPRPRPPAPTIPSEPANRRPAPVQSLPKPDATPKAIPTPAATVETPRVPARASKGVSASLSAIFTIYVVIGVIHSIAFSLFVSRATCAMTTQSLVYVFCHTGTGISHLVTVLGWPWYWL